ncbi:MAG: hypothetical protein KAX23_05565 [Dehalococcoidia bacterium]|jgi:hypothetical protein|nr:hypothetical protein [Chloroflexota bacterium]MCK4242997.1 hypothetical protein [Dehalococcoidia bacterium]
MTRKKLGMKRPPRKLLEEYKVNVQSDTAFRANARLLQSIWRRKNFGDKIGADSNKKIELGNLLPEDIAVNREANFLTDRIYRIVKEAVSQKGKNNALIAEPRIWTNLLSSQPLCFNLFGELEADKDKDLATKLFKKLLPELVKEVEKIKFEYSPGRRDPKYLGDRTAFDIFVEFTATDGEKGFTGIEVKYAETIINKPLAKGKTEEELRLKRERYQEVADKSGIFKEEKKYRTELLFSNIHQIWRDHLLAWSILQEENDKYKHGLYMFLYPKDNIQCFRAISKYLKTFKKDDEQVNRFYPVTIESVINILKNIPKRRGDAKWVEDFENRYLNFEQIKDLT